MDGTAEHLVESRWERESRYKGKIEEAGEGARAFDAIVQSGIYDLPDEPLRVFRRNGVEALLMKAPGMPDKQRNRLMGSCDGQRPQLHTSYSEHLIHGAMVHRNRLVTLKRLLEELFGGDDGALGPQRGYAEQVAHVVEEAAAGGGGRDRGVGDEKLNIALEFGRLQ